MRIFEDSPGAIQGNQFSPERQAGQKANHFQGCVAAVSEVLQRSGDYARTGLKNSRAVLFGFVALIGVLAMSSGTLYAQAVYGSAVGTITDQSGAIIVGATVTLTNVGTGDKRTATANAAGDYQFVSLVPGNYKVDVENAGFKHFARTNVVVQVQGSTRVDAALQTGSVTETVEVTSQAPLIETQQATVGQVVAGRTVAELPLNGRNVFNLLAVAPGVVPQGGTAAANAASGQAGSGFGTGNYQISGGIPNTGAEFVDGSFINTGYINAISYIPSQDSIQEFRVEGNNIGPEFGGTENGIVTMVTKSGTNAFHGVVYEYLRNTMLNANTFFGDRGHLSRPAFIQNQFGGTIGGPIKKDKLFFFGSYEGVRASIGATTSYTVPTAAQRAGDFSSSSTAITDPGTFDPTGTTFTPNAVPTTFAGNVIPANRINPTSKAMLAFWPSPQTTAAVNNYIINTKTNPELNQYIGRVDWNVSAKQRLFVRYTYHKYVAPGAPPYGVYTNNLSLGRNAVQNFVIGDNLTLSPTTILDVTVAYFRDTDFSGNLCVPCDISSLGWPAATLAQIPSAVIPRVTVSGISVNGGGGQTIKVNEENDGITLGLTKLLGRHTIRIGGEFRRAPNNYGQTNSTNNEAFAFTSAFTGNPFASYLLGFPQQTITENAIYPASMMYYAGAYVGDTFQMTNKVTLTAGLRWEFPGYWTERHDRQTVFLPDETNPLAGPTGIPLKGNVELVNTPAYQHRTNVLPHYDLFAPRLGLVFQMTPRTVFRGGFGILYAPSAAIQQDAQPYQSPINLALTQTNTTTQPVNSFSNPFPNGILQTVGRSDNYLSVIQGQTVTTNNPNSPATYIEQWNIDVQRDLGHQTLLDIAYVAERGVHQQGPAGLNDYGQGLNQLPDSTFLNDATCQSTDANIVKSCYLLNKVTNPFYGLLPTSSTLNTPKINAGQLLRPYPQYADLHDAASVAYFSKYSSLQAKLEKRFSQGGNLLVAYTWGSDTGNADTQVGFTEGVQPGEVQDWTNLKAEVSQLSYNVPQLLVISYVQDLPFGKGKRFLSDASGVVDKVVSGWGIDGITSLHSGFPLPLTAQPTYLNSIFGAGYARPNVVPGCNKKVSGSAFSRTLPGATWFNTSCFTQPGQFQFGNEARVDPDLRMQGVANWDLSLFKATAVTERFNVQFRAEIFNLFNRVQLGYPNLVCCSTSNKAFGTIGSQLNAPRQIQFALKMSY